LIRQKLTQSRAFGSTFQASKKPTAAGKRSKTLNIQEESRNITNLEKDKLESRDDFFTIKE
jgi:hypothetical protein